MAAADANALAPFMPEPTEHVIVAAVPADLARKLQAHADALGEGLDALIVTALRLHLDSYDLVAASTVS